MSSEVGTSYVPKYLEMLLSATASLIETIKWQAFAGSACNNEKYTCLFKSACLDAKHLSTAWRDCYMTVGGLTINPRSLSNIAMFLPEEVAVLHVHLAF